MSNPFTRYGIEHLSPSSLNLFVASPALFILERCMGKRGIVGAAAHRGNAVEAGIMEGLLNGSDEDACIAAAERVFQIKTALSSDPQKEAEAKCLAPMVRRGLAELKPYGRPSSTQGRIEHRFEGLMVPMLGFYDAEWDEHGVLLDLKTTKRFPLEISEPHARQVALYTAGRSNNYAARIAYVSPTKSATYQLENSDAHLKAIERIAMTCQRFLSISTDPMELAALVVPDTSTFYFKDPMTRAAAFEVWSV